MSEAPKSFQEIMEEYNRENNIPIDVSDSITHSEFVSGARAGVVGFKVMGGEAYQLTRGLRKAIFNILVLLYLVSPFILIPGPITIEERRTFKKLAEQLADANEKISRIDEELAAAGELTPDIAQDIVTASYEVLLAQSEIKLMDASDLPYSRETILEAGNFLTEYLTDLRTTNPQVFQQQQYDALLNASQTLYASLDLFYDIDSDDKERVADLNNNWRKIEDRIENDLASEIDQLWMQQAKLLVVKYQCG